VTSKPGDRVSDASFAELYRAHYARVLAYALRRADRATAEDVVSETFLIAWRRRAELVGDPLPWLLGVARRVLANQLRASRRAEAVVERAKLQAERSDDQHDVAAPLADAPIAVALASLGGRDRECLILTAWDGLSSAQAARVVGSSAPTFRVRLHRAKRRLEKALADLESQPGAARPVLVSGSKGSP
jgi:RNA polymerase sigma-70 factor (ECF subfamily)